jgi:hypothetical protein
MILFVDDLEKRFNHFLVAFPEKKEAMLAISSEQACSALLRWDFDEVWLDHDAGSYMWAPNHSDLPTFYVVAIALVLMDFKGKVYVHTGNPAGADRILNLLRDNGIEVERPDGATLARIWGGPIP